MQAVTPTMFDTMRKAFLLYTKKEKKQELPKKFCFKFMETVNQRFQDDLEGDCLTSISIRDGQPHLSVSVKPYWNDEYHLAIGGLWMIKDSSTRTAAMTFTAMFIRCNPFTAFKNTVWLDLFGYDEQPDDDMNDCTASMQCLKDLISENDTLDARLTELQRIPYTDRETLLSMLNNAKPRTEQEKQLKALLKEGIKYIYNTPLNEDYDGTEPYCNIVLSQGDFFPITLKENPIPAGFDIIENIYEGDWGASCPHETRILENNGTLTDPDDREGFAKFTEKLTETLNSYYK